MHLVDVVGMAEEIACETARLEKASLQYISSNDEDRHRPIGYHRHCNTNATSQADSFVQLNWMPDHWMDDALIKWSIAI